MSKNLIIDVHAQRALFVWGCGILTGYLLGKGRPKQITVVDKHPFS